jgi:RHS repeat-associated protein
MRRTRRLRLWAFLAAACFAVVVGFAGAGTALGMHGGAVQVGAPPDRGRHVARVVVSVVAFAHRFDSVPGKRVVRAFRREADKAPTSVGPTLVRRSLTAFSQCPPDGADTSCGVLVTVTDSGTQVQSDSTQGPLDGVEDTLIGMQNNSSGTIGSLQLSANTDLFGFDGDGLCFVSPRPSGCPFGTTLYEGPGTSFSGVNPGKTGGIVNFNPAIAPGQSGYFSLEEALTQGTVFTGGPSTSEQGGPPNPAEHPVGCSTNLPVNCATGAFWHQFDDLSVPGRGVPLDFQRTYSSANAASDGPLGFGWTDSYNMTLTVDQSGNVTISQEDASTVNFSPNGSGGYVAAPRVLATLVKNGDGSYTFTRNADLIHFTFSAAGQLLREVDRNGYTTTLAYNGSQLASVTDPAGRSFTFTYSGSHIASVAGPGPRTESFGYDGAGELTSATDPANGVWSFTYNTSHQLLTMTDPRNDGSLTNVYTNGQVTSQTDPLGTRTTHWAYTGNPASPAGGTTTVTDPKNNITTFSFQNLELLTKTLASGTSFAATTSYVYDPATLGTTSVTDPDNHTSSATYDSNGNQISFSDALTPARTTTATYNSLNEPLTVTDPSNVTTARTYDTNGNLLTVSRPLNGTQTQTVSYHYADTNHPGDVTSITDPNSHATTFTYDSQGDPASVTDAVSDKTTFVYDVLGQRSSMVSPRGNVQGGTPSQYTTSYTYDPLGRLTLTTDPLSHTSSQTYDGNSNLTSSTDGRNNTTNYTYDADNELTKITRPDTTTLQYSYDGDGNQTSQTDGNNKTTSYGYDPLDRVASATDPLNRTTSYGYDLAGNRTSLLDSSNQTTSYGYDAANELTSINYSDGTTPNVSFTYTPNGPRQTMADGTGTTSYSYDQLNRLTGQSNTGSSQSVGYGYDLAGNLTRITYPNSHIVSRGYDNANRLTSISDWLNHTTNFTPDPNSNTTTVAYPNGITTTTAFDAADQLSSITHKNGGGTTLASFTYTRDNNGQLQSTTPTGTGQGSNETYAYNTLNKLTAVNSSTYNYDAADNLTHLSNGATLVYNDANEASLYTPSSGPTTALLYDQRGDRLNGIVAPGIKQTIYSYDEANRLVSATAPASAVAAGKSHSLAALKTDGSVWAWGDNLKGELGNGTTTNSTVPVPVSNLTGVTAVAAGDSDSFALKSDGTVWAWGLNSHGQLGNGTTTNSSTPVQVSALTGITAIAAGSSSAFALALKSDGTVWAWGANDHGQLGNGNTTESHVPVQVKNLTGVTAIAAGDAHGLARKSDGTAWAWGSNNHGQLGNGHTNDASTRVQVSNLSQVISIAAGGSHSLAWRLGGGPAGVPSFWTWGYNGFGQLGVGTTTDSSVPVRVSTIAEVTAFAGGGNHSLADQGVAWGYNAFGQLGNGTTTNSSVPVGITNCCGDASALAAGYGHSLALSFYGTVRAWGLNASGQLGNGTTTNSLTPTPVTGLPQTTYTYDGDGLRATTASNGTTQHFAWNLSSGLPLLLTDGSVNYIYDDSGTPVEQIDSAGTPLYYQHDQLGSTRLLTDQSGNTAATYTYDAYGNLTSHTGSADTPLRWNGQYQDATTGLYYLRARYYDPQTSQFVTRDLLPQTSQPYGYANGNPLNVTDPSGLAPRCSSGSRELARFGGRFARCMKNCLKVAAGKCAHLCDKLQYVPLFGDELASRCLAGCAATYVPACIIHCTRFPTLPPPPPLPLPEPPPVPVP